LLEVQVTDLFEAAGGLTTGTNVDELFFPIVKVDELSVTPVALVVTLTVVFARLPPSFVTAEIVAVPFAIAVTKPFTVTDAILALEELHVTVLLVAVTGLTVTVN
jgi:hypothetical protein